MELSDFVATTLVDIQKGVAAAIAATSDTKGVINPCFGGINDIDSALVQKVVFDVAVTATEKSSKTGHGGIQVAVLRLGVNGSQAEASSRVSRIQFTIPIIPPVQTVLPDPNAPPPKGTVSAPSE